MIHAVVLLMQAVTFTGYVPVTCTTKVDQTRRETITSCNDGRPPIVIPLRDTGRPVRITIQHDETIVSPMPASAR